MNTGQVIVFDEETPIEIRNQALMSSASIPFVFSPVEIDGMNLIDGGTFQNVAVGDPITRCKEEEGVEEKDIIVDIILCLQYANTIPTWTKDDMMWSNALDFYRRR